jgi:hypothetical protein
VGGEDGGPPGAPVVEGDGVENGDLKDAEPGEDDGEDSEQ